MDTSGNISNKKHIVHCKICSKEIDINNEHNWIVPTNRRYFHKDCYYDWEKNKNNILITRCDNFWYESLIDFVMKDLKLPNLNYPKMGSQWKNLQKKGFKPKGMYFTLRYLYLIKHSDPDKALGGIGLINKETYQEAQHYWIVQEQKKRNFMKSLETETKEHSVIHLKRQERKREKYNLDDIGGEE